MLKKEKDSKSVLTKSFEKRVDSRADYTKGRSHEHESLRVKFPNGIPRVLFRVHVTSSSQWVRGITPRGFPQHNGGDGRTET
ncbi:hypothetical protein BgiBS90_007630 [Biomphalaria glabrata]|nr:hypothetical protein BgiBS90_007630 [Biomphalaria glabrata]